MSTSTKPLTIDDLNAAMGEMEAIRLLPKDVEQLYTVPNLDMPPHLPREPQVMHIAGHYLISRIMAEALQRVQATLAPQRTLMPERPLLAQFGRVRLAFANPTPAPVPPGPDAGED